MAGGAAPDAATVAVRRRWLALALCGVLLLPLLATSGMRLATDQVRGSGTVSAGVRLVPGTLGTNRQFLSDLATEADAQITNSSVRVVYAGDVLAARLVIVLVENTVATQVYMVAGRAGTAARELARLLPRAPAQVVQFRPEEVLAFSVPAPDGRHIVVLPVRRGCRVERSGPPRVRPQGVAALDFQDVPMPDGSGVVTQPAGNGVIRWRTRCGTSTQNAVLLSQGAGFGDLDQRRRPRPEPDLHVETAGMRGRLDQPHMAESVARNATEELGFRLVETARIQVLWAGTYLRAPAVALTLRWPGAGQVLVVDRWSDGGLTLAPLPDRDWRGHLVPWIGAHDRSLNALLPEHATRAEAELASGRRVPLRVSGVFASVTAVAGQDVRAVRAYDGRGTLLDTAPGPRPWPAP